MRLSTWIRRLFANAGGLVDRGGAEVAVHQRAADGDAMAHLVREAQRLRRIAHTDRRRTLLEEAGLPAARLRRVLTLGVLQAEAIVGALETTGEGDAGRLHHRRLDRAGRRRGHR